MLAIEEKEEIWIAGAVIAEMIGEVVVEIEEAAVAEIGEVVAVVREAPVAVAEVADPVVVAEVVALVVEAEEAEELAVAEVEEEINKVSGYWLPVAGCLK